MSTLYELTGQRLAIKEKLEAAGYDETTIQDSLEGESTEITKKIEDYGYVIKNLRAPVVAIDEEIKRLQERKKQMEKEADRVEFWLFENMVKAGISKVECPLFTIALQKNPPSVHVADEASIPAEYWRVPPPPEKVIDKKAIAAAIKDGNEVPGAWLQQSQRLVIK
jgi:chromosome segregation ATPase